MSPSVDIRELFDQKFYYIFIFSFNCIMKRLKILFVLEIYICTLVLILNFVEQINHYTKLILLDSLNEFLISLKLCVPPFLPRGLV